MYKIKDFSNITDTSIVTLRYYDEIDLFKPSYVDFYSGYRYYEDNQIDIIKKINKLKEFGLSLDEIKEYMKTNDEKILINKMKGYEKKMSEIKEFLNSKESVKYKIIKAYFKKFIELNGILHSKTPLALEVRDNNADYYYILKNDEVYDDFAIYKNINWLVLDRKKFNDKDLIQVIFKEIKKEYDTVNIVIPVEMTKIINDIKNNYECSSEIVNQQGYDYEKIIFKLYNWYNLYNWNY